MEDGEWMIEKWRGFNDEWFPIKDHYRYQMWNFVNQMHNGRLPRRSAVKKRGDANFGSRLEKARRTN
jgi:hypothetical protein